MSLSEERSFIAAMLTAKPSIVSAPQDDVDGRHPEHNRRHPERSEGSLLRLALDERLFGGDAAHRMRSHRVMWGGRQQVMPLPSQGAGSAKAGIQDDLNLWIPASAGMTASQEKNA
jgi:hypothetical protein